MNEFEIGCSYRSLAVLDKGSAIDVAHHAINAKLSPVQYPTKSYAQSTICDRSHVVALIAIPYVVDVSYSQSSMDALENEYAQLDNHGKVLMELISTYSDRLRCMLKRGTLCLPHHDASEEHIIDRVLSVGRGIINGKPELIGVPDKSHGPALAVVCLLIELTRAFPNSEHLHTSPFSLRYMVTSRWHYEPVAKVHEAIIYT